MARLRYAIDKIKSVRISAGPRFDRRILPAVSTINLKKPDGSWKNENGRWWEKDANLVTAYSVMALEIIYGGM